MQTNQMGELGQSKFSPMSTGQKAGTGLVAIAPATGPFAPFVAAAGAILSAISGSKGGPAIAKGADFNGQLGPAGLTGTIAGYSANSRQNFTWTVPLETDNAKQRSEDGAAAIRKEFGPLALQEGLSQDEINRIMGAQYQISVAVGPYVAIYPAIIEAYKAQLGAALGTAIEAKRRAAPAGILSAPGGAGGGISTGTLLAAGAALIALTK